MRERERHGDGVSGKNGWLTKVWRAHACRLYVLILWRPTLLATQLVLHDGRLYGSRIDDE